MLPNPYKVRRKWRYQKAHQEKREALGPKAPNPYRVEDSPRPWRTIVVIVLGVLSVLAMIALLLLHPFFSITEVTIEGTERLDPAEIEHGLRDYLDAPIFLQLPLKRRAYVLANVDTIRTWLLQTYSLHEAQVEKHFPSRLSIVVAERLSNAILDDGVSYRFVGQDGVPFERIRSVEEAEWRTETRVVTSTLADGTVRETTELVARTHEPRLEDIRQKGGNYPIIVYQTQSSVTSTPEALPAISPDLVARTIEWFEFLTKKTTVPFAYVKKTPQSGPYATVVTGEGWVITISLQEPASSVASRFTALLEGKKLDRTRLQYIDVRYPGVVYWR